MGLVPPPSGPFYGVTSMVYKSVDQKIVVA